MGRLVGQPDLVGVFAFLLEQRFPGQFRRAVPAAIELRLVAGLFQDDLPGLRSRDINPPVVPGDSWLLLVLRAFVFGHIRLSTPRGIGPRVAVKIHELGQRGKGLASKAPKLEWNRQRYC